jgi:hypothetical protein
MTIITNEQYNSLVQAIYDELMSNPDFGFGEMGDCKDSATRVVDDWLELNKIEII